MLECQGFITRSRIYLICRYKCSSKHNAVRIRTEVSTVHETKILHTHKSRTFTRTRTRTYIIIHVIESRFTPLPQHSRARINTQRIVYVAEACIVSEPNSTTLCFPAVLPPCTQISYCLNTREGVVLFECVVWHTKLVPCVALLDGHCPLPVHVSRIGSANCNL